MKTFIRLFVMVLFITASGKQVRCSPTPSVTFSLQASSQDYQCVHLGVNSETQILITDIYWPYCQADSIYEYYAMSFPWADIQPGCDYPATSCSDVCTAASANSCFIDDLEWTYDHQSNTLRNVLHGLEEGCVCMLVGVPLTPPQHVHFDPANGVGQSFTCGSRCYFQLCVGPGLSREQTPVLHISGDCDSLNLRYSASGPVYLAPLGVFLYQFNAFDCHLTVRLDAIEPVELVAFTASCGDGEIVLHWQTASEVNNAAFEILRDARLVHVETATNSPSGSDYHWTDGQVNNGTTYSYTLLAVAVNGLRDELRSVDATPQGSSSVVTEYAMKQNYPNPFNPRTNIEYDMKETGWVTIGIYNFLGQEIAVLIDNEQNAGLHSIAFDATGLPSGIYICTMRTTTFEAQTKLLLIK